MMGSGLINEGTMEVVNDRMECALQQLKEKYDRIREQEAKEKAEKEAKERAEKEKEAAKAEENDWRLDDPELEKLRLSRIAALQNAAASRKGNREAGHGDLREIAEDEFLREVTSSAFVCVHFYHPEFETCKVMDKHLRELAARALQTKFLRLNATKAAFFVAKLKVKTLPTLVYFKDGIAIGRQVGYEGLRITTMGSGLISSTAAASTDFSTPSLARSMREQGVFGTEPIIGAIDEEDDGDEEDEDAVTAGVVSRSRRLGGAVIGGNAGSTTLSNKSHGGAGIPLTAEEREAAMAEARKRMMEELENSEDF